MIPVTRSKLPPKKKINPPRPSNCWVFSFSHVKTHVKIARFMRFVLDVCWRDRMVLERSAMKLTKKMVDDLKPQESGKARRLADGGGLYVEATPAGGKVWRMAYRHSNKQKSITFGPYPAVAIGTARKMRDEAKVHIAFGRDPAVMKQVNAGRVVDEEHLFRNIVDRWASKRETDGMKTMTLKKDRVIVARLKMALGDKDIRAIRPRELIDHLMVVAGDGKIHSMNDTKFRLSQIWRFAIAHSLAEMDPTTSIGDALPKPKKRHHSAILDPDLFGDFALDIYDYHGWEQTRLILIMSLHVFLRSGEIRLLEWSHYNEKERLLRVPASLMKMDKDHLVPVSSQVADLLEKAKALSGSSRLMFPSAVRGGTGDVPLSGNTLNKGMRLLGYDKTKVTHHGIRRTASTILNESNLFREDWIEAQLAHDKRGVAGVYNAAKYLDHRAPMMQWWSDKIVELKEKSRTRRTQRT